ncbi:MAG TPA: HAD-IA family hydrolase [Terriglobales bacterium]|nr:HAD-IA family hydrolase [Terriglobales bacterium]
MKSDPEAMIFDLDGVITFTAKVHAAAWKQLFDEFLKQRSAALHEPYREFTIESDYLTYVDGKPRYEGVASFLSSRNISIPYGSPSDSPTSQTVCGLGNRKDDLFNQRVRQHGVEIDRDAVRFVRELRERDIRIGLASSSRNAVPILERAGIRDLFDEVVDGVVSDRLHLRGKPEPDIFLQCLSQLTSPADPRKAGIVEDAVSGVMAGERGHFALVLGVDRHHTGSLASNGANWVINDFSNVTADQAIAFFSDPARAA